MDLMEFKARELFEMAGLPVKKGVVGETVEELVAAIEANKEITFPFTDDRHDHVRAGVYRMRGQ